ncbi:hypothetical protein [Bacillus solitudinis]|uniref:hypothetical protein n=1 Tax=Bacillus solitudinis TaxID=2014074 RepID=UPI0012FD34FD|nr:hypothetical protein [Bacillus solitudinis]
MGYLIKFIFWLLFLFSSVLILETSRGWKNTYFFPTTPMLHFLSIVTPITILILFGMLLRSKHLIKEFKKEGSWSVNFTKMTILGILPNIVVLLIVLFDDQLRKIVNLGIFDLYMLSNFAWILCGYYISDSLHKIKK